MSAGKMARHQSSLTNQTSHFAIMGGLGARVGDRARGRTGGVPARRRRTETIQQYMPAQSLPYMRARGMLSVNPMGSGNVGARTLLISRQFGGTPRLGMGMNY